MNLDTNKTNRLIAMAEIVDKGDVAVLEKLFEFQDFLETYKTDKEDINKTISKIEELKKYLDDSVSAFDSSVSTSIKEIGYSLNEFKLNLEDRINSSEKTSLSQVKELSQRLSSEIKSIKALIPSMPDLSIYESKLEEIKASIPVIKDTILDNPEQIRNKLESLYGDERLDAKYVKNLDIIIKDIKGLNPPNGPMQHPVALSNLPDVAIAGIISGQSIRWNGTYFEAYTPGTGGGSGFQQPLTGALGQATFTWAIAPSAICVDGIVYQKTSQGGTDNWTGTTTTVMAFSPSDSIFAIA